MQSGFLKRAKYTLPVTAGVETDLNFRFVVAYAPEMNLDFSDIRFYDSDDVTLIKHDRFSYTSGVSATFWVKVPSKLAAGQPIYMYYGAPALTDISDPDNVYQAWDDFSGTLAKWTNPQPATFYISSGILRGQGKGIATTLKLTGWANNFIGFGFFARVKHDYPSGAIYRVGSFLTNTEVEHFRIGSGTTCNWSDGHATAHFGDNVWGNIEIRVYSASLARHYKNGVLDYTDTSAPTNADSFGFYTNGVADAGGLGCDYIYIFKLPSDGTEVPDLAVPDLVEEILTEPEISVFKSGSELESGDYIDFGSRYADSDTDISLDINNNGGSQLEITTPVLISGDNLDQFSVNQQPSSPVAPLGSTITIIRFNPNSFGAKVAAVNIINSDPDKTPFLLYLMGYCIRPEFKKFTNRTGRIRIYDGSPTPYYLEMKFDVGNFTGPVGYNDTEELLQLHRGRLDGVQHYIEGDHRRVFDPLDISFGLILEKNFSFDILDLLINGSVGGISFLSTKATSTRKNLSTIEFYSSTYKTFDVAVLWTTANLQGENLGYLYKEVGFFDPSNQKISESEDEIKFDLSGKWYGSVQRITSFPVGVSL